MSDKNKSREIDKLVEEVASYQKKDLQFTKKSKIRIRYAVAVTAFILGSVLAIIWLIWLRMEQKSGASFVKSPLMTIIKTKGCVADGLLTGSGGKTSELLEMINRSECNYLHRSIETWLAPPDFDRISQNMAKIEKRGVIYGMFLAEAINPNAKYDYPAEKRKFDFSKMCKEGSVGFWGEGTCKASFDSKEYRLYLEYITKTAIDLGVQNFLFGQIYFQENNGSPRAAKIVEEMRSYAISKGKSIVVGAQTNDMGDPGYLKLFDYIEGGVGINPKGEIEDGPCFSKWWKKPGDRCWALLWHKDFSSNANDVLLNFDWSGFEWDDMSTFAQMDKATRIQTLRNLYTYFSSKDMGFLMPFLAVINEGISGCSGPQKNFYAPDNHYSCSDEDEINKILKGNNIAGGANNSIFIQQTIPTEMVAGYRYQVSIVMKNVGSDVWSKSQGYYLKPMPSTEIFSTKKVEFAEKDSTAPGQMKIFDFDVFAPKTSGAYNFQWTMSGKDGVSFGATSEKITISVVSEKNR